MVSPAPASIDYQTLQFRQLCKLQTRSDKSKNVYKYPTNLVAVSNLYGLIFIGERSNIKVIVSSKILEEIQDYNPKTIIQNYVHRNIALPSPATHVHVNSDQILLSVAFINYNVPVLRIYNIETLFYGETAVLYEIQLSSVTGAYVNDLVWNPGNPDVLASCTSDGILTVYTFSRTGFEIKSLPKESHSMCACWSPKGKQIVVGNINGFLTQYLPELKAMKNFPPPTAIFENKPCTLINIKWLSNFQFVGVYKQQENSYTSSEEIRACIVVINTPKTGPVSYINYEDICYSSGISRPYQFYFLHVALWNMIFVGSANSIEVGVLSLVNDETTWYSCNLEDSARVILPMNKGEETFPVGVSIDYSSQIQTCVGENTVPMPVFIVLTCEGVLCMYLVTNLQPNAASVCNKPNAVPSLDYFTLSTVTNDDEKEYEPLATEIKPVSPAPTESSFVSTIDSSQLTEVPYEQPPPPITNNLNLMSNVATQILNNISNAFTMPTLTPEPVIQMAPTFQSKSYTQQVVVQSNQTSFSSVSIETKLPSTVTPPSAPKVPVEDENQKAINVQKVREEAMKKLKKKAATFEEEIQEFKQLVGNIKVDNASTSNQKSVQILEQNCEKLKHLNTNIRNQVDNLRTSIIEVTSYVKDIKSKQFLLSNPGYMSLSNVQDVDPVSSNSLKNIEKGIYYAQTQIDLANKQLDELWYKFCESTPETVTRVPKLENIYHTILVQQKIIKVRKLEIQKLEKRTKDIRYRMSLVQPTFLDLNIENHTKSVVSSYGKDDSVLADLTKKLLTLERESKERLNPTTLAERFSKENAKRFMLSPNKILKLQELHSTHTVTYIQSAKLQRLKKKSLIILSKCNDVTNVSMDTKEEEPRVTVISPVSSDDYETISKGVTSAEEKAKSEKFISSTPQKSDVFKQFSTDSFVEEPSNITFVPQVTPVTVAEHPEAPKTTSFFPSMVSAFKANDKETPKEASEPINLVAAKEVAMSKFGLPSSASLLPHSTMSMTMPENNFIASSAVTPATSSFFGTKLMSSLVSTTASTPSIAVKPTMVSGTSSPASQPLPFGGISSGSLFAPATATSTVGSSATFTLSLVGKSEASTKSAEQTPISIFGGRVLGPATTTAQPALGLFKLTTSAGIIPSLAVSPQQITTLAASATISTSIFAKAVPTAPASGAVQSSGQPSLTSSTPAFSGLSLFGKAPTTTANTINFGSILTSTPGSIFAGKSQPLSATATTMTSSNVVASETKTDSFNTFSFASKPVTTSSVTISEITTEEPSEEEAVSSTAEEVPPVAVTIVPETPEPTTFTTSVLPNTTFSFAALSTTTTYTPVKSDAPGSANTVTPAVAVVMPATSAASPVYSVPTTPSSVPVSTVLSTPTAVVTPPPVSTVTPVTSSTASFENSGSFFSGLNIAPKTTSAESIFGKPAGSLFGSSGGGANVFAQSTSVAATAVVTSANESKPLFGSGTSQSIFGQGNVAGQESKNLFSQTQQGGFQSSGVPIFGSGGSIFGGAGVANSFAGAATTATIGQASTFGSNTGSSLFGGGNSGFNSGNTNSLFQGSTPTSGFGGPSLFANAQQQNQTSSGFGSPPAFQSAFRTNNQFGAFGAAPTFGGSPSFGGSPTKLFGQTSADNMGTFGGSAPQQPNAFENLANENTMTFGNLAQQQAPGFGSPPTFGNTNTGPSFGSPGFGGQSFNSWR